MIFRGKIWNITKGDLVMKEFSTKDTIALFVLIVSVCSILFGFLSLIAGYPCKKMVYKLYKRNNEDLENYYFYYEKATAYRMLFSLFLFFNNFIKLAGFISTFVTVYCVVDKNDYILFFSLISAICQVVLMNMPIDKYAKTYVEAARMLEYELNKDYDNLKEKKENLNIVYKEAEDLISREYL